MADRQITGINHCSMIVADTQRALKFYNGLLGLELDLRRPGMRFPGAWLNVGEQQIHLLELPNPDPVDGRPEHGGRDRHLALFVTNLDALVEKLNRANIAVSMSKSGRKAAFCRDYDGNAIELVESTVD